MQWARQRQLTENIIGSRKKVAAVGSLPKYFFIMIVKCKKIPQKQIT